MQKDLILILIRFFIGSFLGFLLTFWLWMDSFCWPWPLALSSTTGLIVLIAGSFSSGLFAAVYGNGVIERLAGLFSDD
jgi:hypothetical protein